MLPILTTPREARSKDSSFDFVPVNIIREDGKDAFARFSNANFGDLSDVSLVPAGTNSRIQVNRIVDISKCVKLIERIKRPNCIFTTYSSVS
jgi:hypothetical protein